ncbi:MAG: helix-turn-helix domain-containing protein [Planctomycetaceae bacterium]
MAGKFVSIEDAARLLGIGIDEVKRLVERKKLFPLRDGKFKVEEIERVRASLGDESSQSGALSLDDLDLPGAGGDELSFDIHATGGEGGSAPADAGSQTIVRGGQAGGGDALSGLALDDDDDTATDSGDLVLEANPGASSPSLARPPAPSGSVVGSAAVGDPLTLDMSNISMGSGGMPASPASGSGRMSGAGSGFSAPADSGLSLEEPELQVSGIDLETGAAAASGVDIAGGSLHGDEFNLGEGAGDEDSASVVIPTDDSGELSFFANVTDDSASVALDSSVDLSASSMADLLPIDASEAAIEMQFSGWQIAGLTCCALVLLTGGIVMYDLLNEIHKPQGAPLSGLLLNAVGHLMGWRR